MSIERYPKHGEESDWRLPYNPADYEQSETVPEVTVDEYPIRGLGPDPVRGSRADVAGAAPPNADGRTAIGWGYHDGRPGI